MKRVRLGGRELRIEDSAVAEFLHKGYSVIDDEGNVVQKGNVTTFNQAVEENKKLRQEIELYGLELDARRKEIDELKAENAALKKDLDELKKTASKDTKSK